MKYSKVINFNPIQSIIKIQEAANAKKAKELVSSYVMSDEMADKFGYGIIEQMQFEDAIDNKGVFIVGNYGSGKSHLMSVISSVALNEIYLDDLQNDKFAEHMKSVAGKFEILRIELGAVTSTLRDIICREIENDLKQRGINYSFPDVSKITSNKPSLQKVMSLLEEKYPNKGYLLVIDELLDYLSSRKEHELRLDLGFLRELGETIESSRLRLVCGIQEQLFENATFSFVAGALNRIKDRYEQVIIKKEDIAYVVSERILSKTVEQKAIVREHLLPFCNLYTEMSERIDEFVELYPIHPTYIDVFGRVSIAEKREILKTISLTVKSLLDKDIPDDMPGIVSFDSYWKFVRNNYARKAEADIKEVMDKSSVLEDKISRSFTKPHYKPIALQIINALSVHRLTTGGIDVPIGLTAENLRDDLCLFLHMPERDSEFLLSAIEVALNEIINIVSGQFIEHNPDNGQYYLDLKKDIDYDARVTQKAATLEPDSLNRYYFSIVYDCLEWDAQKHVPSFEIYPYELNWDSRNIFRSGYLFMGKPNGRSTAQPPRDFYVYIVSPYGDISYPNEKKADEVLFIFKADDKFNNNLKLFTAAHMLRELAANDNIKQIYSKRADIYRKVLLQWLKENRNTCYDVMYKGIKKQLIEITVGNTRGNVGYKETIDIAAAKCLDEYFESIYLDFPKLKIKLTKANQAEIMKRSLEYFAGRKSKDSKDYLTSFGLINDDKIDISSSKYAMGLARDLAKLPSKGVLNRSDLVDDKNEIEYLKKYNIDLYYTLPVLAALVYSGQAEICLANNTILTASNLNILLQNTMLDLLGFKYISKPREAAVKELTKLVEILGLPQGIIVNPNQREKGLASIMEKTSSLAHSALNAKTRLNENFRLWGELLIPEHIMVSYRGKIDRVKDEFNNFKNKYNTVAKLNNFNLSLNDLSVLDEGLRLVDIVLRYDKFKNDCVDIVSYISSLETLEIPDSIKKSIAIAKDKFFDLRDRIKENEDSTENVSAELNKLLKKIKKEYIDYYFNKHGLYRLNHAEQTKKSELISSTLLSNLKRLRSIDAIFQSSKLDRIINSLSALKTCYELSTKEMNAKHICPHCGFIPNAIGKSRISIEMLCDQADELFIEWQQKLLDTLSDPLMMENKELLDKQQKHLIDEVSENKELPKTIDVFFVECINTLISEIDKVDIQVDEMMDDVLNLGPCTPQDLKSRLSSYIDRKIKGKDTANLRIILKRDNGEGNE